jgi:hypothetical protein
MARIANPIAQSFVCLMVLLTLTTQISACNMFQVAQDRTICFVLPDGYRGAFQLVLDKKKGIDVIGKDGRYIYEIPASGVLKVKSFKPFEGWHKEIAVYKSGESIPTEDSTVPPSTVALRLMGTSRRNNGPYIQTNIIGTQEEAKQAVIDEMAGRLKLGKP